MRLLTSVTGISTPRSLPTTRALGFTLWEILVVVIIVTISVSAILFSTSITRGSDDLKILGKDLSKTIRLLYQEAIFENKNFAISLNHQGFSVLEYDGFLVEQAYGFAEILTQYFQVIRAACDTSRK